MGYLEGSYLCGACATRFYPEDDGTCVSCPVIMGPLERYRGLFQLLAGLVVFVIAVGVCLFVVLRCYGGSIAGGATQLVALGIWALTAMQTVSQVSR